MKKPYIIAEVGFNHEGDMEVARQMISAAVEAGADAVKFQTFQGTDLALPSSPHFDLIKPAEMSYRDLCTLNRWAVEAGIDFLSTPFSVKALEWLVDIDVPAVKIASMDCTNHHLLAAVAKTGKRIFLSTGMADMTEIKSTLDFLDDQGSGEVVLLHCISNYPAAAQELNLAAIGLMARKFNRPVGYSDHHHSPLACLAAAILGAQVLETHFTIYPDREDGDHGHSLGPYQLKQLVSDVESAVQMMGDESALANRPDRRNTQAFRRGLYTARALKKGDPVRAEDMLFCRPASALSPSDLARLEGRRLNRDMDPYEPLTLGLVENTDD